MTNLIKQCAGLFLVIILSYFAVYSLFIPGFFPMHDDTQPSRVFEMKQALSDGHFPVRWVSDLGYGYGYPIFNFYAPLSYYIGAAVTLLVPDVLLATKIMMAIGVILSGVCMYLLGKAIFGDFGGVVASMAYMYSPYHAVDIYVRGDVAEFWAYSIIPLVFYSIWQLFLTHKIKYLLLGAVAFALVVLSHNLTAFMVAPFIGAFLIIFVFLAYRKKDYLLVKKLIVSIVLGLLLCAFYWMPVLLEMRYTNILSQIGGGADFRDHFVCTSQLWDSHWGFGGSVAGCTDGMSFKIGKVHLLLSSVSILLALLLLLRRIADVGYVLNPRGIFFLFSVAGFLISTLLTLNSSGPLWEIIPFMAFFQYPWRFLLLVSFFTSLLCGFFVWFATKSITKHYHFTNLYTYIITVLVAGALIYVNRELFIPQTINYKTSQDYISDQSLRWKISKISDEYMPPHFQKPGNEEQIVGDKFSAKDRDVFIQELHDKTTYFSAQISSPKDTEIHIRHAYFPSWRIFINGDEKNFTITGNGITIKLPKGKQTIEGKFVSTPTESVANLLSLVGIFSVIIGIISSIKHKTL